MNKFLTVLISLVFFNNSLFSEDLKNLINEISSKGVVTDINEWFSSGCKKDNILQLLNGGTRFLPEENFFLIWSGVIWQKNDRDKYIEESLDIGSYRKWMEDINFKSDLVYFDYENKKFYIIMTKFINNGTVLKEISYYNSKLKEQSIEIKKGSFSDCLYENILKKINFKE